MSSSLSSFRRLWASTASMSLADGMAHLAIPVLAVTGGATPLELAAVTALQLLPWLVLSPFAGIIADRRRRSRIIRASAAVRSVMCVAVVAMLLADSLTIAALAGLGCVLGASEVCADIAAQSAVPDVVHDEQLETAYGRISATRVAGDSLLGPALSGLLLGIGPVAVFGAMAALFALSGALIPNTHLAASTGAARPTVLADLRAAASVCWNDTWMRRAAAAVAALNFGQGVNATVLVAYAVRPGPLDLGEAGFGTLIAAVGVGSVLGGLAAEHLDHRMNTARLLQLGLAGHVLAIAAPAIVTNPIGIGALMFGGSLVSMSFGAKVISTRQRRVAPDMRGRVNSLFHTVGLGAAPVGALAGGIALDTVGFRPTFIAASVIVAVTVVALHPWTITGTNSPAQQRQST